LGYDGFQSYGTRPYPALKPGMKDHTRGQYFADVTTVKPDGAVILSNYERFKTSCELNTAANVKKGDYKVPRFSENTMGK